MSVVSNLIITCIPTDQGILTVQGLLRQASLLALEDVARGAGGNKQMEAEIWAGAYHQMDLEPLLKVIKAAKWDHPECVRMFLMRENEDAFGDLK